MKKTLPKTRTFTAKKKQQQQQKTTTTKKLCASNGKKIFQPKAFPFLILLKQ